MKRKSRANKGQFSIISALLVSVILVMSVISMYTMVRHTPLDDSPAVLSSVGEMNSDIKSILDFTVGYYGSILRVTGNSTYARELTTNYLSSGLLNIARSHPEWNPSFELDFQDVSTCWFMPNSYSMGSINVTYSLAALGIEGIQFTTSSALSVELLDSSLGIARISVTRDNSEPELGLNEDNFWFYNYSYADSNWELVNPTDVLISSNGVYTIELPSGVNPEGYSVQIEDNRGLIVPAYYSQKSLEENGIPQCTYSFDWESTGVLDIYQSLNTDNFVIELLQNGTLKWLGEPLALTSNVRPVPPVSVKALRINATIDGVNQQVPFQIETWASDYMVPLGLAGNDSIFKSNNMLVFSVNDHISEITLWWEGNDTAIQTPYAWQNVYFNDNPSAGLLNNGVLQLNVHNFYIDSTYDGTGVTCRTDFMRVNNEEPQYGDQLAYVIYNGIVRDIIQQEPEYGGGVAGCPNFYSQVVLTLPANTPYYTYRVRTIFIDSSQSRTVSDLSAVQLTDLSGSPLTEDGTSGGYPDSSSAEGLFYDGSPTGWDHHWSQFISGVSGSGIMFTDDANDKLYTFDSIIGSETGAIVVNEEWDNNYIELNPVERNSVPFTSAKDITWCGAVVTFNGEPIFPTSGNNGLWVMVENPPAVSLDAFEETIPTYYEFADTDSSNVDLSLDKGSHSDFSAQLLGPDSVYDTMTEASDGGGIEEYVDNNTSDVDSSADLGSHSSFLAMQAGPDSVYDTLIEENTSGSSVVTLLDDGFEDFDWDGNWDDSSSDWQESGYTTHGGFSSAWAQNGAEGTFTSNSLDASDASAIYVDFWFRKDDTDSYDFTLYYYDGSDYNSVDELDNNGGDDTWLHFTATITDSEYFVSDFRIRFDATLDWGENVWVDDVVITKEVQSSDDYRLDLEVQFTDVVDLLPNNELCIYAGSLGSEDLRVDYRSGSNWVNLATDLTENSWNNFTVSITSPFTVRFTGGSETGDEYFDQWQIDTVLLNSHGGASNECEVDNETSDVDSSSDLGTLLNFDNMKTSDASYATLSESSSGGVIAIVDTVSQSETNDRYANINKPAGTQQDDLMIALLVSTRSGDADGESMFVAPSGWTLQDDYTQSTYSGQHVYVYWRIAGASEPSSYTWQWSNYCGWVAQITTFRGVDTASPIHVAGTVNQESSSSPMSPSVTTTEDNCMIWLYDMCDGSVIPYDGGEPSGTTWITRTTIGSPGNGIGISTAYFVQASSGATGDKDWALTSYDENSAQQFALRPASGDCRLDQEIQWNDVPCGMPNANLSIYCGSMGSEDLAVDVWTGTDWETAFTSLSTGWNNVSITQWLTDSDFTIRFRDGIEVGDSSPDSWQIDVASIHLWNEDSNYQLDLEIQWTNVDYEQTNEELCIYVGNVGTENLGVQVWYESAWVTVFNDLEVGWNNVTISSYLTGPTFTIRFIGQTEVDDPTQSYWTIDATLIHRWS